MALLLLVFTELRLQMKALRKFHANRPALLRGIAEACALLHSTANPPPKSTPPTPTPTPPTTPTPSPPSNPHLTPRPHTPTHPHITPQKQTLLSLPCSSCLTPARKALAPNARSILSFTHSELMFRFRFCCGGGEDGFGFGFAELGWGKQGC